VYITAINGINTGNQNKKLHDRQKKISHTTDTMGKISVNNVRITEYNRIRFFSTDMADFKHFSLMHRQFTDNSYHKPNSQLFHKLKLRCAKPVKNIFFSRAKSMLTATSDKWKRNITKHI
jgi:hypothetical protein